ncbi:MAG: amidophosphoribosyltransferase [Methanomassiliicoccales archaeon PtaU1.Bin124]|nr:MAG: amidophosphoribosyltransferase [Methanomassiliicoccales archaeon PtaU1.Bin124]
MTENGGSAPGRTGFRDLPYSDRSYLATRPPELKYQMGGCGIAGLISLDGRLIAGDKIKSMLTIMEERENGLGSGYACYGLFPRNKDDYCLQFFFDDEVAKERVEDVLNEHTNISRDEKVFTQPVKSLRPPYPIIWRYFLQPRTDKGWNGRMDLGEEDLIINLAMHINAEIDGAMCISSGKDMAVFKGNGFSYEMADFYDLSRYKGAMWISHSRFPTNSPAWWAGAHPLSILDWGVCHNGEITSYGVNKKLVEMSGYKCTVLTDTEVVAYMWDLLVRKHGLPIPAAAFAMAPRTYEEIGRMDPESKKLATWLRFAYREAFLNGPFSILVGRSQPEITLIALADRKKLRPMIMGRSKDGGVAYCASEECAIRIVDPDAETWVTNAGSPMVAVAGRGILRNGTEHPFKGVKI